MAEAEILPLHLADKKPRPKRVSRQTADREWDEAGLYRSKQNPSGYRGISQVPSGRYKAQHSLFGKLTSLGTFDTAVEAAMAYARAVGQAETTGAEEGRAVGRKRARGRGGWRGGGGGGGTLSQLGCHIAQHSPLPQCPKARRGYGLRRGRASARTS